MFSMALYRQMVELAAALRGNIYAHQDTENFCVQKVGNSLNIKRYKNKSMYRKASAGRGQGIAVMMLRSSEVSSGLTMSAFCKTTKAKAAWAGGAMNRKKVGCGRSARLSRAGDKCWKFVMKTSSQKREPTDNIAHA